MRLTGKLALITGRTSGFGAGIVADLHDATALEVDGRHRI